MSMIDDIEGKLKDISLRFRKKKPTVSLTPQQRNLLKLKKIWEYIDKNHGPAYKDVYITNTPLPNYVQVMLNILEKEERQINSNSTSPISSPHFYGISHSNQAGACMEFMLGNNIFGSFVDAALQDQPFGLLQVVIESFSHLCGELNPAFLTRQSVQRSLNKLIYVTATNPKLNELYDDYLIELIFVLCQKIRENPSLINFFMYPKKNPDLDKLGVNVITEQEMDSYYFSSSSSKSVLSPFSNNSPFYINANPEQVDPTFGANYEFFIFNYLMNYYFKAGNRGDYALTAISILLELDYDLFDKYLLDNDFPLVITASLCGAYNALPTFKDSGYLQVIDHLNDNLEFKDVQEFEEILKTKIDKEKELFYLKNKAFQRHIISEELNVFLRILQFIQKITDECKNLKIVDLFLYYFNNMFVKNVLNKQVFSSEKIEEDDYSHIFYLKLIINNLHSPAICQLIFKNLFPENVSEHKKTYLKTIETIYDQYQKIIREKQDALKEQPPKEDENNEDGDKDGNQNENENENDEIINNIEIVTKETSVRLRRLNSLISPIDQYTSSKAVAKEVEEKLSDPNYFTEKLKVVSERDSNIKYHHEKESSLAHYATSEMNLAAICEDDKDAIKYHKNLYSYIVPRLNGDNNGLRLVTLQLLATLLSKQNSIAIHKLFPCYFYSKDKVNQCQNNSSSVDISPGNIDINLKSVKEDTSYAKIKELEMEYLTTFHTVYHFKKLFQMNFNQIDHRFISNTGFDKVKTSELQEGRYLDLFKSFKLPNLHSDYFIYPYLLDVGSSIQYNEIVGKSFNSKFADPLKLPSPNNSGNSSVDVSQYINIPNLDETNDINPIAKEDGTINSSDLLKLLDKEKMDDIISIMTGFQNNQLLQCLLSLVKSWLENSYEINLVLSGVFHQLFTSADHFFLYQYLIMNDQILPDGEKCSLFTIIQQHIQKFNNYYDVIKTFPRVNDLYISMYEKIKDIQENAGYRNSSRGTYITMESAVDISNICNYNGYLENIENEDPTRNASQEFEALLQSMDGPSRQDFLNMFKVPTIKNMIALMEFLKDIIASLHIQFEHFALA